MKDQEQRALEVGATDEQIKLWKSGVVIQNTMPNLSNDDREYILTGMSPEEWDALFLNPDDEDY